MNNALWIEKYRPRTLNEIIGLHTNMQKATEWLTDFQAKKMGLKRALLFSGPPGLGKTTLAHCLFNSFGYRVHEYNASDLRTHKLIESSLHDVIEIQKIDNCMKKDTYKPAIIMDEVDGMLCGDRGGIQPLIDFINPTRTTDLNIEQYWIPPIICICNATDQKIYKTLLKDCLEIKFSKPDAHAMGALIDRISTAEKMPMTAGAKQKIIAEVAQGDIRRLVQFLQYLYCLLHSEKTSVEEVSVVEVNSSESEVNSNVLFETEVNSSETEINSDVLRVLTVDDVQNSLAIFAYKEFELNMSDGISNMLNKLLSPDTVMKIYNHDKGLAPLLIHENYPANIALHHVETFDKIHKMITIIRYVVQGDIVDHMIYNHQSRYLQPIHGIYSCVLPSYQMNHSVKNKEFCRYTFATALNRFSNACTNRKTINSLRMIMSTSGFHSPLQIQTLSRLVYTYLKYDRLAEIAALCLHYNLQIHDRESDLEHLLKIDFFRAKKDTIPNRQKKELVNLFQQGEATKCKLAFLSQRPQHTEIIRFGNSSNSVPIRRKIPAPKKIVDPPLKLKAPTIIKRI